MSAITAANDRPSLRTWVAIMSLSFGALVIVTSEFTPVGFLPNAAHDLNISLGAAGAMVLVPGLAAGITAPLVIVGTSRIDRRALIAILTALVALSNGLAAVAPDFAVVLVARVFLGIAIGGFWSVVPQLGFRLAGPKHGTRATSIVLAGLAAGTVIGLPAGQYLGTLIGWRGTFGVTAIAVIPILAAQLASLPPLPALGRVTVRNLRRVLKSRLAVILIVTGGAASVGQFAASTFVTPYLTNAVHLSSNQATLVFLGYGVAGIVGPLIGPGFIRRSSMLTFAIAAAGFGAVLILLPFTAAAPIIAAALIALWGVLWGLIPLALQTRVLDATPTMPEAASSVLISSLQFGIAVGAGLGGIAVDALGLAPVYIISGALAISAALARIFWRESR
jgi:predicted MFS family arabinose efflux permease